MKIANSYLWAVKLDSTAFLVLLLAGLGSETREERVPIGNILQQRWCRWPIALYLTLYLFVIIYSMRFVCTAKVFAKLQSYQGYQYPSRCAHQMPSMYLSIRKKKVEYEQGMEYDLFKTILSSLYISAAQACCCGGCGIERIKMQSSWYSSYNELFMRINTHGDNIYLFIYIKTKREIPNSIDGHTNDTNTKTYNKESLSSLVKSLHAKIIVCCSSLEESIYHV